ncbi:hypothetical protein BP00DRAFT_272187 [Aspergillus indologenus CBS 114.80]|uniref:Uncharacterized protein n=1 Tax=Aspergillus indologenus CBS 114.80 TaxID=1450541 RepID=A0A2V5HZJ3_9EURO|nr:hypothetical protein BP00DRAFT_272187 [Aspergillus indologenus CBS 114.80]
MPYWMDGRDRNGELGCYTATTSVGTGVTTVRLPTPFEPVTPRYLDTCSILEGPCAFYTPSSPPASTAWSLSRNVAKNRRCKHPSPLFSLSLCHWLQLAAKCKSLPSCRGIYTLRVLLGPLRPVIWPSMAAPGAHGAIYLHSSDLRPCGPSPTFFASMNGILAWSRSSSLVLNTDLTLAVRDYIHYLCVCPIACDIPAKTALHTWRYDRYV